MKRKKSYGRFQILHQTSRMIFGFVIDFEIGFGFGFGFNFGRTVTLCGNVSINPFSGLLSDNVCVDDITSAEGRVIYCAIISDPLSCDDVHNRCNRCNHIKYESKSILHV